MESKNNKNSNIKITIIISIIIFFTIAVVSIALYYVMYLLPQTEKSGNLKPFEAEISNEANQRPEEISEIFYVRNDYSTPMFISETFYDKQNGNVLPYRLYIPSDYDANEQYPVILFLHGAGEIGTDNQSHISNAKKMFVSNGDLVSKAIVVCPQSYEWWNLDREYPGDQKGTLGSVLHLLNDLKTRYSCDGDRIYVTGLSMGGYATWQLLEEYGHLFAAGMPICGGGNPYNAEALKEIPIRIYHSMDDPTVSYQASKNMYDAIKAAGGEKVQFIQLNGLGHNSWDYAYSDREGFSWMFAQDKTGNPSGNYEEVPLFRVVDHKGRTVISDKDIQYVFSKVIFGENKAVAVDLVLTGDGENKLKASYKANSSKEFTVYWYAQKLYTFTVNGQPIDNTFSIKGVFDSDSAKAFCSCMEKEISY